MVTRATVILRSVGIIPNTRHFTEVHDIQRHGTEPLDFTTNK